MYYDVNEEDKSNKKHFKMAKKVIDEANGIDATEEQVHGVLHFMRRLAQMQVDHFLAEADWDAKLKEFPAGYHFKETGYCCRTCGHGASGENSWYDKFGLKCMACQKAVDAKIIPGELNRDKELFYSEAELSIYFNVSGKPLRDWIKKGIIKCRVIPGLTGGTHYKVFLMRDNKGFLPPKEMLHIGGMEKEVIDGKEWMVSHPWYHYVDPFVYLKKYRIMQYLQPKAAPVSGPVEQVAAAEVKVPVCNPCSFPGIPESAARVKKRKAKRK